MSESYNGSKEESKSKSEGGSSNRSKNLSNENSNSEENKSGSDIDSESKSKSGENSDNDSDSNSNKGKSNSESKSGSDKSGSRTNSEKSKSGSESGSKKSGLSRSKSKSGSQSQSGSEKSGSKSNSQSNESQKGKKHRKKSDKKAKEGDKKDSVNTGQSQSNLKKEVEKDHQQNLSDMAFENDISKINYQGIATPKPSFPKTTIQILKEIGLNLNNVSSMISNLFHKSGEFSFRNQILEGGLKERILENNYNSNQNRGKEISPRFSPKKSLGIQTDQLSEEIQYSPNSIHNLPPRYPTNLERSSKGFKPYNPKTFYPNMKTREEPFRTVKDFYRSRSNQKSTEKVEEFLSKGSRWNPSVESKHKFIDNPKVNEAINQLLS